MAAFCKDIDRSSQYRPLRKRHYSSRDYLWSGLATFRKKAKQEESLLMFSRRKNQRSAQPHFSDACCDERPSNQEERDAETSISQPDKSHIPPSCTDPGGQLTVTPGKNCGSENNASDEDSTLLNTKLTCNKDGNITILADAGEEVANVKEKEEWNEEQKGDTKSRKEEKKMIVRQMNEALQTKSIEKEEFNDAVEVESKREGGEAEIELLEKMKKISTRERINQNVPANIKAQEKLANAEKKLAEEMRVKKEKRLKYKAIIEEDEIHLKVLAKQMHCVSETIKEKEQKITEMKLERKEKPLMRKFGTQFQIAKSVLKKERLEDDLSILKSQSASRRRRIQKYKTKIRYDLQILKDPTTISVNPSSDSKPQPVPRPIPACFFVGNPAVPQSKERRELNVASSSVTEPLIAIINDNSEKESSDKDRSGSQWTLNSVEANEISLFTTQQVSTSEDGNPGPSSAQLTESHSSSSNMGTPCLTAHDKSAGITYANNSATDIGVYDVEDFESECTNIHK